MRIRMKRNLKQYANAGRTKRTSKEEYRVFREGLEEFSEKVGALRNNFYNHAFSDGTLLKIAEVREIVDKLYGLVDLQNTNRS